MKRSSNFRSEARAFISLVIIFIGFFIFQPNVLAQTYVSKNNLADNYHISPIMGATGYTWSGPSGAIIVEDLAEPNDTSVTIDWSNAAVGAGQICVVANNDCGGSIPRCLDVFVEDPIIGLAKDLVSVVNNNDGTYDVNYLLTIENFGNVDLSDLILYDDIINQFNGLSPTNFNASDGTLTANAAWSGGPLSNIFQAGQGLAVGASGNLNISCR